MFLNASVNPLIYGFNNDNFRRAYDQTPLCKCFKRNTNKIQSNVSVILRQHIFKYQVLYFIFVFVVRNLTAATAACAL